MGGGGWLFQALGIIFPPLQPIVRYYSAYVAVENGDIVGLLTSQVGVDLNIPPSTIDFISNAQDVINAIENNDWMGVLTGPIGDQIANIEIPQDTLDFLINAQTVITAIENNDWAGLLGSSVGQQLNIPQGTIDFIGNVQDIVEASESGDWAGVLDGLGLNLQISEDTLRIINAAQDVIIASENGNWAGVLAGQAGVDLNIDEATRRLLADVQAIINANASGEWVNLLTGQFGANRLNLSEETIQFLTNAQAVINAGESGDWASLLTEVFGADVFGIPTDMQNLILGLTYYNDYPYMMDPQRTESYAMLSDAVYTKGKTSGSFERIQLMNGAYLERENVRSGFYGQAFWDRENEKIVVAFRGSEKTTPMETIKDWIITDVGLGLGILSEQFDDVKRLWSDVYEYAKYYGITDKIEATGHSLGGALAQYMVLWAKHANNKNVRAETFGSPGIMKGVLNEGGLLWDMGQGSNTLYPNQFEVINHTRDGDLIGKAALGGHVGVVYKYQSVMEEYPLSPDYEIDSFVRPASLEKQHTQYTDLFKGGNTQPGTPYTDEQPFFWSPIQSSNITSYALYEPLLAVSALQDGGSAEVASSLTGAMLDFTDDTGAYQTAGVTAALSADNAVGSLVVTSGQTGSSLYNQNQNQTWVA